MDPRSTGRRALRRVLVTIALMAMATAAAPQPSSGTKSLYLFDEDTPDPNGFGQAPLPVLSRTPPPAAQVNVRLSKTEPPVVWTMTPELQAPLTIDAGVIRVVLNLSKGESSAALVARRLELALASIGATTGPIGSPVTQSFSAPSRDTPMTLTVDVPLSAPLVLQAGSQITLTITNTTNGGGSRVFFVWPVSGGTFSRIDLPALTVINVDAVGTWNAPWPGGLPMTTFSSSSTVSIRSTVSDPFGAFDISAVRVDATDADGMPVLVGASMTLTSQPGGATGEYEYLLSLPSGSTPGTWNYAVTALEGTEGAITHTAGGSFVVGGPELLLTKSVATLSDPINGTTNPKAIPTATMLYTLTVANLGLDPTDADSVEVVDRLPPEVALFVDSAGGDPITFIDGSPASGLLYDYSADVSFSSQPGGGAPYNYVPSPDASGFDAAVTGFRITPRGSFAGTGLGTAPEFEIRYRVRID